MSELFTSEIKCIGYAAADALSPGAKGRVIGITSRGFFALLGEEQVVFGSKEPEASPLTLNLELSHEAWNTIEIGRIVEVNSLELRIGKAVQLTWKPSAVWKPPLPELTVIDHCSVHEHMAKTAQVLLAKKGRIGFGEFLTLILGDDGMLEGGETNPMWVRLEALRQAMEGGDIEGVCQAVQPLYGMGQGLTPSGDDVVVGLLLVLKRWRQLTPFEQAGTEFARRLVAGSVGRTTRISQAIIASAAEGYADERLLNALDGMVTGALSPEACAELLARYGGSSGVDALVGMAIGLG